ncbi:hypothetical protein G5I_05910 [Acromyrmex echinatior]|uniref:Uncharacterized protein n=1 Tax=Acromyrmex echinatior TaxID=103372 RepID=F4WJM9_ACREC|nr:hypothetical protein G5I_05910 [Acromyrmex echinatior]
MYTCIQELEKSIARTFGRPDKCAWIFWWHQEEDETFAAGSPLEAHGRFSKGWAVEVATGASIQNYAKWSNELAKGAAEKNICTDKVQKFHHPDFRGKQLNAVYKGCSSKNDITLFSGGFTAMKIVKLALRPSSYAEMGNASTVTDTAMACKIVTMNPMNTIAIRKQPIVRSKGMSSEYLKNDSQDVSWIKCAAWEWITSQNVDYSTSSYILKYITSLS